MLLRAVKPAIAGVLLLSLSGCGSPVTSAYVAADPSHGLDLIVPDECGYEIDQVRVAYLDPEDDTPFDDLETVWWATAKPGGASRSVRLFSENPGFTVEVDTTPVGEDRAVLIWWTEIWENGNNAESSLSGVLGDIEGDDILWYDGVTSQTSYRGAVEAPFARFRC